MCRSAPWCSSSSGAPSPPAIAEDADRHIDYPGAFLLAAALVPFLIGFTNKQFGEWTDPDVGGLIALGFLLGAVFVFAETRAKEPIVPLGLFRIRAFTASVMAFFLAAMGFFAAVVFLPRWFQFVLGNSATESGYQILPLLLGLIIAAVVDRSDRVAHGSLQGTDRGRAAADGGRPVPADQPAARHGPVPQIWLWMAITGLGVGPTFAVFTLVVQNAVPVRALGTATSSLTLFQQLGGTIGLAITGTLFGSVLLEQIPKQMTESGRPGADHEPVRIRRKRLLHQSADERGRRSGSDDPVARCRSSSRQPSSRSSARWSTRSTTAFSFATAAAFVVGIVTALLAALVVLVLMPAGKVGEAVS